MATCDPILLHALQQESLLEHFTKASENFQRNFSKSFAHQDIGILKKQIFYKNPLQKEIHPVSQSFIHFVSSKKDTACSHAKELLKKGSLALVVLAGGDGSRLGFRGPKGMYPLTPVKNKTLFQRISERVYFITKEYGIQPYLIFITSPANDQQTREFFHTHHYFGLDVSRIIFCVQSTLPALSENNELLLNKDGSLFTVSDGNLCFWDLYNQNILEKLLHTRTEHISIVSIDNPLLDPFHLETLDLHICNNTKITATAVERAHISEAVGVFVETNNTLSICEYTEQTDTLNTVDLQSNKPIFPYANISFHIIQLQWLINFIHTHSKHKLPLHRAKKNMNLDQKKSLLNPTSSFWKYEYYIFDILPYTSHIQLVVHNRKECFAPLKNQDGSYSPETVRQALEAYDKNFIYNTYKQKITISPFELSPIFYYSTQINTNTLSHGKIENYLDIDEHKDSHYAN